MFQKQCILLCSNRAVASGFCGTIPRNHQLQHQLHHLLRGGLQLQKGLVVALGSHQKPAQPQITSGSGLKHHGANRNRRVLIHTRGSCSTQHTACPRAIKSKLLKASKKTHEWDFQNFRGISSLASIDGHEEFQLSSFEQIF